MERAAGIEETSDPILNETYFQQNLFSMLLQANLFSNLILCIEPALRQLGWTMYYNTYSLL